MKQKIEWAAKLLIFACFFVPLIVVPTSYIFPFIVPKIIWFRSLVTLLAGCYAVLLYINWSEYRPRLTPLNIALGAFVLSFGLSTFFGVDWYHSFWDNHERMLGLFTIVHYALFYLVATSVFKTWTDWKWVLRIFLFAGLLVVTIGLLQKANPNLLLNQGNPRVSGTLGNAIYLGGYGVFLAFTAFLLAVKEKNVVWRAVMIVGGILGLGGMLASGTRGSVLGLLAGMAVAVVGYIAALKDSKILRKTLIGVASAGLVLVSMLVVFRKTEFVSTLPAIGRTVNTSLADVKASPRWIAWEIAWQSFKEKPVFGWGPNNYFYAFNTHYNPRSLDFGYGETWFDNAHNIIMNTLAVQGGVGLLSYLSIFIIAGWGVWRSRQRGLDIHVAVIGIAFLAAHLVGNITVFENPTSYLYFMFWLALLNANIWHREAVVTVGDKKISWGGVAGVAVFCFLWIFLFNIQPAKANKMTLGVIRELNLKPTTAIVSMNKALAFASPHIDDIRSDLARTVVQVLSDKNMSNKLSKDGMQALWQSAYDNLSKNLVLHPMDIRNHLALSSLAQMGYAFTSDPKYISASEQLLEEALKLSPRRQQIIYSLATLKSNMGKQGDAELLLQGSIKDNPKIDEGYWRLAYLYSINGRKDKAKEIVEVGEQNGVVWSEQGRSVVGQVINNIK